MKSRLATELSGSAGRVAGRLPALLFAALVLTSCGSRTDTPGDVVERFYTARIELNATGAPTAEDLKKLSPYMSEELRELLQQARRRHDDDVASAPGDKPSFADGDLFSSLFEGPDTFEIGADEATGDVHRVSVQLAYNRQQPVVSWTDKAVVKTGNGKPVITDIEYGGNWEFGNKGTLVSMLKHALAPLATASILGDWNIAGHRIPGVSALNDAQAKAMHGQVLNYAPDNATSGKDVCPHAGYKTSGESAGSFLAAGFRVTPKSLGLQSADARLEVTKVSCGGVRWTTIGGTLLQTGQLTFTPWNGVFFECSADRRAK